MDEAILVKENYDKNSLNEWERLEGFHFEWEITIKMMAKYLKKGTVLDIGGGPGRYSIYLAKLGYDVTLIDLSTENVRLARKKALENNVSIKAYECDARDLSKLDLTKYDNVLLMGPLYHLFKVEDREKCVLEAKKHLKDDGVFFATFITISAGLNYYLSEEPFSIINEQATDLYECMEKDITWSGSAFTEATFINALEILPFFKRLGFEKLTLFGQEGVTGTRLSTLENAKEEVRNFYLDLSLRLCENKQYFAYNHHLMYIGKIKKENDKVLSDKVREVLMERFNKDSIVSLATVDENNLPWVRNVDAYFDGEAFYTITYALSKKMKHIMNNNILAISGEWFSGHAKGENLGSIKLEKNKELLEILKEAFKSWYYNGHINEDDENTIILKIVLTDGILYANNHRIEF